MIVIREIKCTDLEEFRLEICKKLMTYFGMACKKREKQTVVGEKNRGPSLQYLSNFTACALMVGCVMFSPAAGLKNRDSFLKTMILLREQGRGGERRCGLWTDGVGRASPLSPFSPSAKLSLSLQSRRVHKGAGLQSKYLPAVMGSGPLGERMSVDFCMN